MEIKSFDQLDNLELDTLREIGSIGTGNAATALSQMLNQEVRITLPEVRIMGYNEAIEWIGGAETITAGVLVRVSGAINGIMLAVQQMEYINLVLKAMLGKQLDDYNQLDEIDTSALIEVGNIMISTFMSAFASLTGIAVDVTVPSLTVDMQGAILAVPMAEYGGQSDYIMTIGSNFMCADHEVPCRLLFSPEIKSLNFLLEKLGVKDE